MTRRPIILTCHFFPIMNMSGPRKNEEIVPSFRMATHCWI